jgi:hypothetical protein
MKPAFFAAVVVLALSGGVAFAQGGGGGGGGAGGGGAGGGGGEGGGGRAIGNSTTTSMGAPAGSPEYSAPRSTVVPGLPAQAHEAQQDNTAAGRQTNQGVAAPVQGPTNPVTGNTQVAH